MIKLMRIGFFYWGLKILWMMRVGFEKTWTASWKSNASRVSPNRFGWVFKT